jgi:carbon monoxide dehydrogenase subunit G
LDLRHEFTVPASVEETWDAFNDIESVAACFPGATVTSVEGDSFQGSCKVKLGPIALVYNGSGTFVEKNESARRMVIDAKGKDKRGNGTAGAHVTATMTEAGTGTRVEVLTELAITGKPAQFGRGVMQDVSDKLLGQFTDCLEQKVGDASSAAAAAAAEPAASTDAPDPQPAATPPAASNGAAAPPTPPTDNVRDLGTSAPSRRPTGPQNDDAIDLGATVLPVLLKSYWRQALGVILVLLVLRRLLRRG